MRRPDGPQAVLFGNECNIAFKSKSEGRRSGAEVVEGGDGRGLLGCLETNKSQVV